MKFFQQNQQSSMAPYVGLIIKPLEWEGNGEGSWHTVDDPMGFDIYYDKISKQYLNVGYNKKHKTLEEAKQFADEKYQEQVQSCLKWNLNLRDDVLMVWGCLAMILVFTLLTNIFAPGPNTRKETIASEYNYRK